MKKFLLLLLVIPLLLPQALFAASPSLSFRPGRGDVILDKTFIVDIMINSAGQNLTFARASFKFDPTLVEVIKAERNSSLFCTYPEDEQSVDNENGLVMVTGFCQSGSGSPYKTTGSSDVFARVTFNVIKDGDISLEWEYTGEDEPFQSVLIKDGSPPQNLLTTKPSDASFDVVPAAIRPPVDTTPETGLGISVALLVSGIMLVVLGFVYTRYVDVRRNRRLKTIVVYDKKD